jgi:hypothetical protein
MLDILTDLQVQNQEERIKTLERQVSVLKKYIKDNFGVDLDLFDDIEKENEKEEEQIMTLEELEYHISKIEMYSDVFNYGRVESEGKKMAESL